MKKVLIIANMLFASATVWGMVNPTQIAQERSSKNQKLKAALIDKDVQKVKQSIAEGADINAQMSDKSYKLNGRTPLTFAIEEGCYDLVKALIESGANVNLKDDLNETPLTKSISITMRGEEAEKITDLLLQSKCINLELLGMWGMSPLAIAMEVDSVKKHTGRATKKQLSMTKKLLRAGANVNGITEDENMDTPLMRAVLYRNEFMIQLLMNNSANVNARNRYGDTAASLATRWGYADMLELLSDPTPADMVQLLTAWKNKISYSSSSLQSLLCKNINKKNNNGYTLLMSALEMGQTQTANWLINRGADVNLQNKAGRTALMFAARAGLSEIVQELLKKGARANLVDKNGHSALWFAEDHEHTDVVAILNSADK